MALGGARRALLALGVVAAVVLGVAAAQAPVPSDNAPAQLERRFDVHGEDAGTAQRPTSTDAGVRGERTLD